MSANALKAEKRPLGSEVAVTPDSSRSKRRKVGKHLPARSEKPPSSETVAAARATADAPASQGIVARKVETVDLDWNVTPVTGGRFNDCAPVLTHDKKHLILALDDSVQVYSIATSSILRIIQPIKSANKKVVCHRLSASNDNLLYISSSSGETTLWNWTTGVKLASFNQEGNNVSFAVCSTGTAESAHDITFSLNTTPSGASIIHAATLENIKHPRFKPILRSDKGLQYIQTASDGKTVIAIGGDQLVVGYTTQNVTDDLQELKYTWLELQLPVAVTCMDLHEEQHDASQKKASKFKPVDLVLGDKGGAILVYRDLVGSLQRMAKDHKAKLNPSRFHWHRFAVRAVRWSRDGNYLISGGHENVLVLWQLDSGRKQFLPHLSSHICSLTVSQSGDAYAVKLADNSAMVLSTAELKPTANVSGLQVNLPPHEKPLPPAILHPLHSDHLLVAVPAAPAVTAGTTPSNSFLQTFDTRSGRHVSRQALTRTNVSVHATGPEGTELTTPDVTHFQVTSDGQWLATVDDWALYKQSAAVCSPPSLQSIDQHEIFLKFWHWNELSRSWDLNTRVEAPHFDVNLGSTIVLDVAANPEATMFATIGGDSTLRLWIPRLRARQRNKAQGSKEQTHLLTWKCHRSISLEKDTPPAKQARLCFSPDGSVLAVSWSDKKGKGIVHLINPHTGEICHSRYGLYAGSIQSMGFVNRYLVVLSDHLLVWDIVADETESAFAPREQPPSGLKSRQGLLAFNPAGDTYAVLVNGHKGLSSRLTIHSTQSITPGYQTEFDRECLALLFDDKSSSFVIVDSASRVLRISSPSKGMITDGAVERALAIDTMRTTSGLQNLLGHFPAAERASHMEADVAGEHGTKDTKEGLASILDVGPSFASSGVQQLFNNVVKHLAA